ncbi:MAG TPA: MFS transporter [Candidatus Corynebacterium gallistercoris]|uniref:MFS transporter n=1 Tax=Candidatus Corynebacterium gallistercoris TaxID=2838530 RepID=A0A9D1RWD0_9CORY|nr:MFS transporter [Candidatus Corynebacterium gallistercoris]
MPLRSLLADTTPLKHVDFRRLWTANIVTVIGAQLNIIAVPAQIYVITGSSAYVGLVGLFGLVPLVIFGLYGGAVADAVDRRILLHVTTIGMIATAAGFWAQAATGMDNVWLILALFAVQQGFFAVNQPTRTAIIPKLVGRKNIAAATSLNMTVMQAGAIAGPLVGGALIPVLGFSWLYFLDFLALFATLWAVHKLPALPPDSSGGDATPTKPGLSSVLGGFAFLLGHPIILMTFVVDLIAMVFGSPRALIPQMSHENFGEPAGGGLMYALLFAALPLGAVLGGVFSGRVVAVARRGLGVTISVLVWGAAIVVMGVAVNLADGVVGAWAWVALVAFAAGGAADMCSAVLRSTMLQEAADDNMRGRLQGVFIVVVVGGPRIADILHGWGGTQADAGTVTWIGGVAVIVGTLVAVACVPRFLTWTPQAERTVD